MNQLSVKRRALFACEESQALCIEFRKLGWEAYSCDTLPCSGGHQEWHIQADVFSVIDGGIFTTMDGEIHTVDKWDLVISFQPCTDLAVSGAKHFETKRNDGRQEKSIRFFFEVWKKSNCSENPIGIMGGGGKYIHKHFPELYKEMKEADFPFKATQIIQPWQFGHGETKATCLFLRNIPKLIPTNVVEGREQRIWKMPPDKKGQEGARARERSKTYSGIALAMAHQWGVLQKCEAE